MHVACLFLWNGEQSNSIYVSVILKISDVLR